MSNETNPKFPVTIKKTAKKLKLSWQGIEGEFKIEGDQIDLIEIDAWISDLLFQIHESVKPKGKIIVP